MSDSKLNLALKWGGAALIIAAVSPIILMALKGVTALIGIAVLLAFTTFGWPVFTAWLSTAMLKLLKMDARSNPIETMQDIYAKRRQDLGTVKEALTKFRAEVASFRGSVASLSRDYPADAQMFKEQLGKMEELVQRKAEAIRRADDELVKYAEGIKRAQVIWDVAQASAKLTKAAGKVDKGAVYEQIRHDEAIKAVDQSMAMAFAELDALRDESVPAVAVPGKASSSAPTPLTDGRPGQGLFNNLPVVERAKEN